MVKHSNKYWAGRLNDESEFAAGSHADTAYSCTKLSALSKMPYPRTYGDNMYPYVRTLKEQIEANDDGDMGGLRVDAGWIVEDGSREDYVQDAFYLDHLIACKTGGFESIPADTYALHWQDHIRAGSAADTLRFESYGCYVKELGFVIPKNDGTKESWPYWKITDTAYASKKDTGEGDVVDSIEKVKWLRIADAPFSTKASFTIGASSVQSMEGELKIKMMYDEDAENGDDGIKYPYYSGCEIEFTVKCRNYTQYSALLTSMLDSVDDETLKTLKITTGLAATFIQITNMEISDASRNRIPQKGLEEYDIVLKSTSGSVLTKEAS